MVPCTFLMYFTKSRITWVWSRQTYLFQSWYKNVCFKFAVECHLSFRFISGYSEQSSSNNAECTFLHENWRSLSAVENYVMMKRVLYFKLVSWKSCKLTQEWHIWCIALTVCWDRLVLCKLLVKRHRWNRDQTAFRGVNNAINLTGNDVLTPSRVGDCPKSIFHKQTST